ncbi:MAG: efflux RND transporter permease subunit [Pseudomonadota bacterium]
MLAQLLFSNKRYTLLFILVIILVGLSSLNSIGRQEDPTITNLFAFATTVFPGADPARVESQVSKPLEERLREISEIETVESSSTTGVSRVTIELNDRLEETEIELAWSEVREALSEVADQFPPGVQAPILDNDMMTPYVRIVGLRPVTGETVPPGLLTRIARDFADDARNFPGTDLVRLFGAPDEEIRVDVDERAMAARGITLAEVAAALRSADPRIASGRLKNDRSNLLLEIDGQFDSLERIRSVVVRTGDSGGVRISDIADVRRAVVTPPSDLALVQGQQGVLIGVAMRQGLQVDTWSARFGELVQQFQAQLPDGLVLETVYDQAGYTQERLGEVLGNLALGVTLVVAVLLVTLGWRAALVVALALPLCSLMSLSALYYWGVPIHQMSITGLIVALGLLVDSSIVMTDEIRKRLQRGMTVSEAIGGSVERLRVPLISSTATTILAFMPMVILPGPAGDFLGSIAKAVVVMLGSSFILALTLTPAIAGWLLPGGLSRHQVRWWDWGIQSGKMGRRFSATLDWSLSHKAMSIALALILPIAGFLAFPTLTAQFFPGTDRDQFYIQVHMPEGRSIYDSHALALQMDEVLRQEPLIRRVDWSVGESAPPFYYNMMRTRQNDPGFAEALVLTHDEAATDALIRRQQVELDRRFPQAQIIVRGVDQGPPVMAPVEVKVFGPNLATLRAIGDELRRRMQALPDVTHTNTSLVAGAPKVEFRLDEDRLRRLGLNLTDVAAILDTALEGVTAGELLEDTERMPVRARLAEAPLGAAHDVAAIQLPASVADNERLLPAVALSTLGDYVLVPASGTIVREDGERTNNVQAYLVRGVLAEEVLKELRANLAADPIDLPEGYRYSFGGNTDERAGVVEDLVGPFGLVFALLMATIVLTFNSWRLSGVTFVVTLCSIGLSLLSLAIFRYPFGVQALIGVIGSIGVSINAAIIIITALQRDAGVAAGDSHAVRTVVMDASRHILSTTITTFGGFLPLILSGGSFWPPFAMAIAGGVLLSTVVSFFLVPPLYMVVYQRTWSNNKSDLAADVPLPGR